MANNRINGWKAIGAHFGRDRTTAIRWANSRNMPVHRVPGTGASSVFAYSEDLNEWAYGEERRAPNLVDAQTVQSRMPTDPTIAKLFVEARTYWSRRDGESLLKAIEAYRSITLADPTFAPAHAALADCYILLGDYGAYTYATCYPLAFKAAEAALAIDPSLAAAYRGLGSYHYFWSRDTNAAGEAFRKAVDLRPDDMLTRIWFGNALIDNGEFAEARIQHDHALLLDAGPIPLSINRAWASYLEGPESEGIAGLRLLSEQFPANALVLDYLYLAMLGIGDIDGFLECLAHNEQAKAIDATQSRADRLLKSWRSGGATLFVDQALAFIETDEHARPAPDSAMAALFISAAGQRDRLHRLLQSADVRGEKWAAGWIAHVLNKRWRDDPEIVTLIASRYASRMAQQSSP